MWPLCTIKKEYVLHIRTLKQALNHELVLKKVRRVIKFKQEAWLKPFIDTNTELRKNAKNDFEKDFFNLTNNAVFGKTIENIRKYRDITLATTKERTNDQTRTRSKLSNKKSFS